MEDRKQLEKLLKSKEYLVLSCMKRLHIFKDYEDFYQIGMIALFQAIKQYDKERDKNNSIDVFAYYHVLNHMRNEIKRSKRYSDVVELMEEDKHIDHYNFEEDVMRKLEVEYLMRHLTDDERELLELKKLGLTNHEIAAARNTDVVHLKNQLKAIFKKVRERAEKVKIN